MKRKGHPPHAWHLKLKSDTEEVLKVRKELYTFETVSSFTRS